MTTALVLSGGGAKGSFEMGVLQYLYKYQFRPDIICSTSVGSVNGLKLAEGEGEPAQGFQGLEKIWLNMKFDTDMYVEDSWFQTTPQWIKDVIAGADKFSRIWDKLNLFFVPGQSAELLKDIKDFFDIAKSAHGIYNLQPIQDLGQNKINLDLLRNSNIKLRMATVGLQSGEVRYVTEFGKLLADPSSPSDDPSSPQVDVIKGMLASAAIPFFFEMQSLAGDWYVDGGLRQIVPIEPAVNMGATEVYAIVAPAVLCAPPIPGWFNVPLCSDQKNDYTNKGLLDIGQRAATDIPPDQILNYNLYPRGGWSVPVLIMRPNFEVESSRTIDPGLIRINMAYGFMRAFDVLSQQLDPSIRAVLSTLSDQIAVARKQIWDGENQINSQVNPNLDPFLPPVVQWLYDISNLRWAKNVLMGLINCRLSIAGPDSMPPDAPNWPMQWEAHQWDPINIPSSPWNSESYYYFPTRYYFDPLGHPIFENGIISWDSDVPQATPPVNGCPQFRRGSSPNGNYLQSDYGTNGNFEMIVIQDGHLKHYWRDNDDPQEPWHFGPDITQETMGKAAGGSVTGKNARVASWPVSVSFFRSVFANTLSPHCNFEALAHMMDAFDHDYLLTYYFDAKAGKWMGPIPVTVDGSEITGVTGNPVMIQSDYGNNGNFEMIVIQDGHLKHYWRDNDDPQKPWHFGPDITQETMGTAAGGSGTGKNAREASWPVSVSFFQSNFRSGSGNNGNFEILAHMEDASGNDFLVTYYYSADQNKWIGPIPVTVDGSEITGVWPFIDVSST